MAQEERVNEWAARKIVSHTLGVPVECYDDNSQPSMVDAVIRYPDGRVGAVEVVADHDRQFNELWRALERRRHVTTVEGLGHAWNVVLYHHADLRRVDQALPELLIGLEAGGHVDLKRVRRTDDWHLADLAASVGVRMAFTVQNYPAGTVHLRAEGWTSVVEPSGAAVGAWVLGVLERHPGKAEKLRRHSTASERHIFIWATIGSSYEVQRCLEPEESAFGLLLGPPPVPEGITHLWVAGSMATQSAIAWSRDRGWWRTGWVFPNRPDEATE